jgi:glycosyltransferase involved in cell wall biosynthesis
MRILRVIASTSPASGGPIEGLLRSSVAMQDLGQKIVVASLDDPTSPWLKTLPLEVHALGPRTRIYGYSPRLVPWLRRHASEYDAVIVHGFWNYVSLGSWRALVPKNIPYFIFAHGMLDPWFREGYPLKHVAKQIFWCLFEGRVARAARAVLFTTDEERRLARMSFWGHAYKELVVAYGTSDALGDRSVQMSDFARHASGLNGKRFILFLSRIHPKKGCDILLRAFARIANSYPQWDLVMGGPDQIGWQPALEKIAHGLGIAGRVHWIGMLTGHVKWGALYSADALILPSHQENFGIVVAEALACGTPVLITDKVNIWREVESARAGFVARDNEDGITTLLKNFFSLSEDQRAVLSEAARAGFLRYFSIDRSARDIINTIDEFGCSRRP